MTGRGTREEDAFAVQARSLRWFSPPRWDNQASDSFKLVNKWPANASRSFYFQNDLGRVTKSYTEVTGAKAGTLAGSRTASFAVFLQISPWRVRTVLRVDVGTSRTWTITGG